MPEIFYEQKLQKMYTEYFTIGKLRCPALNNTYVYFNQYGFRHFLRSGKAVRPIKDQIRRFALFRYAKKILSSVSTEIVETRILNKAIYYALVNNIGDEHSIKVIVRRINTSELCFVSIMNQRKQK